MRAPRGAHRLDLCGAPVFDVDERAPWSPPHPLLGVEVFDVPEGWCPFCRFRLCSCGSYLSARTAALEAVVKRTPERWREFVRRNAAALPWSPASFTGRMLSFIGYRDLLANRVEWAPHRRNSPEALRLLLLGLEFSDLSFADAREVLRLARVALAFRVGHRFEVTTLRTHSHFSFEVGSDHLALNLLRRRGAVSFDGSQWTRTAHDRPR